MITHNAAFALKATEPEQRHADIVEFRRRAENLAGKIPGMHSIRVVSDLRRVDGNFDMLLISTHTGNAELEGYQTHPLHLELVEYGKTIIASRACVDYED